MNRKLSSVFDVIDIEEMFRRRDLIKLANKVNVKNIGNQKESEMCERFILNFKHPVFRYLLKYKYEYCEGYSHLGRGDIVFSSEKKVQNILNSEVLIIEAKYLDLYSSGKNQCVKRTYHRKKVIEQLSKSMEQWKSKHQKDNIYGSILINELNVNSIPIYDMTNKNIIIGYLYHAKRWYQDKMLDFDLRTLLNMDSGDDKNNKNLITFNHKIDENQNSSECLLMCDTVDDIEIDEEEMVIRRLLIQVANIKNIGKPIEKESDLCERFILNFKHPVFRYLLKYEYEYNEGLTNEGSGDIVFSSSKKKKENISETSEILIIEAKYLDRLSSGRNKCGKRTKHRKKVIEQVNTSMKQWKWKYECDNIYGSILINEPNTTIGIKENILIFEFSNKVNEKIYLSCAKKCSNFDPIDSIECGEFNFDLKKMMTISDRLNSFQHDKSKAEDGCRNNLKSYLCIDEDHNKSENSFLSEGEEDISLPSENDDENEIDQEEELRYKEIIDGLKNLWKPHPYHG